MGARFYDQAVPIAMAVIWIVLAIMAQGNFRHALWILSGLVAGAGVFFLVMMLAFPAADQNSWRNGRFLLWAGMILIAVGVFMLGSMALVNAGRWLYHRFSGGPPV